MLIPDFFNAIIEMGGAYFAWSNYFELRKDAKISGVNWLAWVWYVIWGCWDLFYVYPTLGLQTKAPERCYVFSVAYEWSVSINKSGCNNLIDQRSWIKDLSI